MIGQTTPDMEGTDQVTVSIPDDAILQDYTRPTIVNSEQETPIQLASANTGTRIDSGDPEVAIYSQIKTKPQAEIALKIANKAKALGMNDQQSLQLLQIGLSESRLNQDARNPGSSSVGVSQMIKGTAAKYGKDPANLDDNIDMMVKEYKEGLDTHNGNSKLALIHYTQGPGVASAYAKTKDPNLLNESTIARLNNPLFTDTTSNTPQPSHEDITRDYLSKAVPTLPEFNSSPKQSSEGFDAPIIPRLQGAVAGGILGGLVHGADKLFFGQSASPEMTAYQKALANLETAKIGSPLAATSELAASETPLLNKIISDQEIKKTMQMMHEANIPSASEAMRITEHGAIDPLTGQATGANVENFNTNTSKRAMGLRNARDAAIDTSGFIADNNRMYVPTNVREAQLAEEQANRIAQAKRLLAEQQRAQEIAHATKISQLENLAENAKNALPDWATKAGRAIGTKIPNTFLGRAIPGAGAGWEAVSAKQRYDKGDYLGAGLAALNSASNAAMMFPPAAATGFPEAGMAVGSLGLEAHDNPHGIVAKMLPYLPAGTPLGALSILGREAYQYFADPSHPTGLAELLKYLQNRK